MKSVALSGVDEVLLRFFTKTCRMVSSPLSSSVVLKVMVTFCRFVTVRSLPGLAGPLRVTIAQENGSVKLAGGVSEEANESGCDTKLGVSATTLFSWI